jgi:hypothetical protein
MTMPAPYRLSLTDTPKDADRILDIRDAITGILIARIGEQDAARFLLKGAFTLFLQQGRERSEDI